ncbi:MAG: hypothetical protein KGY45_01505 [Hadesarchaea archaeon]|nr:hypothetical protein [Hadesarchaea archaeon]
MVNVEEQMKKLKMNTFKWSCPKCGKEIGPMMNKNEIIELAENHMSEKHEE